MSKLISVSDEIYANLSKYKMNGRSFTEVIRLFMESKNQGDIMEFAGILKDDKDLDDFKATIQRDRRAAKSRKAL
jgi:predicted CopG family antitoxin